MCVQANHFLIVNDQISTYSIAIDKGDTMKINSKAVAAAILVPAMLVAPVMASTGQITGGDNYLVKNLTKNGQYMDPASADKCEVLEYKVRIHNVGPDTITNVNVKATLDNSVATSHSSTVTVTSADSNPTSRTDTAAVNLSSAQSLAYVPGSTELLDANNGKISTLPDTIFTSGVNINSIGVSTEQKRYVQFQANVNCPTTPATPEQPGKGGPVITPAPVTELPQTGAEAGLAGLAGTGALGYAAMAYRRSRKALANAVRNQK
jgi:uncharacterized repeat protein (TIGR01451 family)